MREQAKTDKGHGKPGALTSEERAELSELRNVRERQAQLFADRATLERSEAGGGVRVVGFPAQDSLPHPQRGGP
ncbi:hypothetical protein [Corallococcus sp. EGB]|uniref:hypothetical protein n=1 Tax=Corallococcus sp. EGB TaxID=1521117 RepID=UPI001CBCCE4F|nr:hypothetical protein [Corallococcus sp. EGB]